MKVSTCEKCSKFLTCSVKKDSSFTGVCHSFLSYAKAKAIVEKRIRYTVPSKGLTYNPFLVLKEASNGNQ